MSTLRDDWTHIDAVSANMRRAELGAQAIGVLDVLLQDGDIPSAAVRDIARQIVDEWDALGERERDK